MNARWIPFDENQHSSGETNRNLEMVDSVGRRALPSCLVMMIVCGDSSSSDTRADGSAVSYQPLPSITLINLKVISEKPIIN